MQLLPGHRNSGNRALAGVRGLDGSERPDEYQDDFRADVPPARTQRAPHGVEGPDTDDGQGGTVRGGGRDEPLEEYAYKERDDRREKCEIGFR